MVEWLVPISLFWIIAAVYLGGADIRIRGGSGPREMLGLLLTFGVFLGVWALLRMLVGGFLNGPLTVAIALVGAAVLLPLISRLTFRIVGVRITGHDPPTHPDSA